MSLQSVRARSSPQLRNISLSLFLFCRLTCATMSTSMEWRPIPTLKKTERCITLETVWARERLWPTTSSRLRPHRKVHTHTHMHRKEWHFLLSGTLLSVEIILNKKEFLNTCLNDPVLDKSDPIEKSKVVVQFPSAERFKPSYVHRCAHVGLGLNLVGHQRL